MAQAPKSRKRHYGTWRLGGTSVTVFSKTEQEAIILKAVWGMIDDMVNYEMFVKNEKTENTNLLFNTAAHARLFNILLGDFLSQPQRRHKNALPFDLPEPPSHARPTDLTYFFYLRQVCEDAKLGTDANLIRELLGALSNWLEAKALVEEVWFPSISTKLDIRVQRIAFLNICGDSAKHNFARLEANVKKICKILADNGHPVDEAGLSGCSPNSMSGSIPTCSTTTPAPSPSS